jgi:hypothetical protein
MSDANWDSVVTATTVDAKYNEFMVIFRRVFDKTFPLTRFKPKSRNIKCQWFTPHLAVVREEVMTAQEMSTVNNNSDSKQRHNDLKR